jgi:hypothetical protein
MSKPATNNSAIGPVKGKTYCEIQLEQMELDASIRRRKPGLDAAPMLKPGESPPKIPGYTWNVADRGPPPDNGDDPSGTRAHLPE